MKHLTALILTIFTISICHAQIPAGYYQDADNKTHKQLLSALNLIVSQGYFLSYGSGEYHTWQGFYYTDRDSSNNTIIDRYSNEIRTQSDYNSVEGMHIEHALPKSWWGGTQINAYKDLHNLYPGDGLTNIHKSNLPLGTVQTPTYENGVSKIGSTNTPGASGRCFEPADEYKGDFARTYFYVVTAYNNQAPNWQSPMLQNNTYPVFNSWALDLLLQWHRQDPVSTLEISRNNNIYNIQGNRNPFIDYPDLVEHIWGPDTLSTYTFPQETDPYFSSPNRWTELSMGINIINTPVSKQILVKGANITSNTTISLKSDNSHINISHPTLTPSQVNTGTYITINVSSAAEIEILDTLQIVNPQLDTTNIPINTSFISEFMTLPVENITATTANISCMNFNGATAYEFTIIQGETAFAGNLIFATYIEGSGWNKALEIFNATGHDIDLSHYSLRKQNNGVGPLTNTYRLSGTLADGESFIMVHGAAADSLKAKADLVTTTEHDDILAFNGNDAIALLHNGIIIDMIGELNNATPWGENLTLVRKTNVIHPYNTFISGEWSTLPTNHIAALDTRIFTTTNDAISTTVTSTDHSATITNLTPNTQYLFTATALGANQNTVNYTRFFTSHVPTTEAYQATYIYATEFRANWEQISQADSYTVEVFTLSQSDSAHVFENFNSIGSNGKPLAEGWSGTASGRYTSTTSSGLAPNSLCLKNNGEWIETAKYPSQISNLSFMCRFPSGASDGYLLLEGIKNDGSRQTIDTVHATSTSKNNLSYPLDSLKFNAIRWTYTKVSGNCALDDINFSYCEFDTSTVCTESSTTNTVSILNLTANSTYFYNVTVLINGISSQVSNTIKVSTNDYIPTINNNIQKNTEAIIYVSKNKLIHIDGITQHSLISIYSINGTLIHATRSNSNTQISAASLPKGVYIIKIDNSSHSSTLKVII